MSDSQTSAASNADGVPRVLLAKPGLDGHDVGVKLVGRALMDAGMEVTYLGLRQSPENIVAALSETRYDVLGLSILSGAHVPLCRKLRAALDEAGAERPVWIVGGVIPERDHATLRELGVDAVFPTQAPFGDIVRFIEERVSA